MAEPGAVVAGRVAGAVEAPGKAYDRSLSVDVSKPVEWHWPDVPLPQMRGPYPRSLSPYW